MKQQILDLIKDFYKEHGYSPPKMYIHQETGFSRSQIDIVFAELIADGEIRLLEEKRASNYEVTN